MRNPKWPDTGCKPVHELKPKNKTKAWSCSTPCCQAADSSAVMPLAVVVREPGRLCWWEAGQSFCFVKTRQNANAHHWHQVGRWLCSESIPREGGVGRGALPQKHRHCTDTNGCGRHSDDPKRSWVTRNCPTDLQPRHKCPELHHDAILSEGPPALRQRFTLSISMPHGTPHAAYGDTKKTPPGIVPAGCKLWGLWEPKWEPFEETSR